MRASTKITIVVIVVVLVAVVVAWRAIPSAQRPTLVRSPTTSASSTP
jgi:hypothetical protein